MYKHLIGKRSEKVKNTVERNAVKNFALAIGDAHPLYMDEKVGLESRYEGNIAPPTFPQTFNFGEVKGLTLPKKGLIHGEQSFHYERPLKIGEAFYCYTEVVDYYERKGSSEVLNFLSLRNYGEDPEEEIVFTTELTLIINEAVRRRMNK